MEWGRTFLQEYNAPLPLQRLANASERETPLKIQPPLFQLLCTSSRASLAVCNGPQQPQERQRWQPWHFRAQREFFFHVFNTEKLLIRHKAKKKK